MRVASLALALALAALASPLAAQVQPPGRITGVVLAGSRPLPDVHVSVMDESGARASVVSDAAGRFAIRLDAGEYELRAEALGYRPAVRRVDVTAEAATPVTLQLTAAAVPLSEVVVSASRLSAPASTLPVAVKVIDRAVLSDQATVSTGLSGVLSKVVPGLAAATGSSSLFGQSFRGRNVAVLIDGVPQSTGRNVMRDFETIDASAIERVEVLGGATAIYGDGATGGVINIITRAPAPGLQLTSGVSVETSPAAAESGAGMRVLQSVSGQQGRVDYLVSGSWSKAGSFFDGEGDRIPADPQGQGGLADYRGLSVLAKLGASSGDRRAELSVNRFSGMQHTEYTTDPAINSTEPGEAKARAIGGLDLSEHTGTENLNVIASFNDAYLMGGGFRAQLFFRDYLTRFAPFDGRSYLNHVAQSFVDSRKLGGRAEIESRLPVSSVSVVWGVDYTDELSYQGLNIMDAELFDESGGRSFRKVGETKWVPEIASRSLGLFAQLGWSPLQRVSVRGGLRHERVRMHVDDFTTVTGNAVSGGDLDYTPLLLNIGAVVNATSSLDVFGSYAQGFSLADIGRVLRAAPAGFELGSKQLDAQLVDHYELGIRAHWNTVQASASAFYNESELGTTFDAELDVVRAPERIRGFETTVDVQPLERLSFGGSLTWSEGESRDAATGQWVALNGFRIQPLKVTAHAEHRTASWWRNRVQLLHSGSRDRAFEDGLTYGQLPVTSYTVVDWLSGFAAGPGRLDVGVQNLLDRQYFPVVAQLYAQWGNSSRAAARGRTVSVGYTVTY